LTLTLLWQQLIQDGVNDTDCRYMVDLLMLADNYSCEQSLGRYVVNALEQVQRASIKQCRELFRTDHIEIPVIVSQQHCLDDYDYLLGAMHA
jgi:hypothetical protein